MCATIFSPIYYYLSTRTHTRSLRFVYLICLLLSSQRNRIFIVRTNVLIVYHAVNNNTLRVKYDIELSLQQLSYTIDLIIDIIFIVISNVSIFSETIDIRCCLSWFIVIIWRKFAYEIL